MADPAYPTFTEAEAQTRETFLALMWALSYPGRMYRLPASGLAAFRCIADCLLDLETSYYAPVTSERELQEHLARTGARALPPQIADYHFYASLTVELVDTVKHANTGTALYPDQSATLIIACIFGTGKTLHLSGPGTPADQVQTIQIDGVPDAFWGLRKSVNRYPRGWDVYLVDGKQVVGLPRTTSLVVEE